MLNQDLKSLFQKKVTRKEFLGLGALAVASLFGVAGIVRSLTSHAETPAISSEAEDGITSAGATIRDDPSASGGKAIEFAAPVPTNILNNGLPNNGIYPQSAAVMRVDSAMTLHPQTSAMQAELLGLVTTYKTTLNYYQYDTSVVYVPYNQPVSTLHYDNRRTIPRSGTWFNRLTAIPIPEDAVSATGRDAELCVVRLASDGVTPVDSWEGWHVTKNTAWISPTNPYGWGAEDAGWARNVATNRGFFDEGGSCTATHIPDASVVISVADSTSLVINHALGAALRDSKRLSYVWPAQASDGGSYTSVIPEGSRFRLRPAANTAVITNPLARAVAVAFQKYGCLITDKTDSTGFIITCEDLKTAQARGTSVPTSVSLYGSHGYILLEEIFNKLGSEIEFLPDNYGKI